MLHIAKVKLKHNNNTMHVRRLLLHYCIFVSLSVGKLQYTFWSVEKRDITKKYYVENCYVCSYESIKTLHIFHIFSINFQFTCVTRVLNSKQL